MTQFALITGATSGLGEACAVALGKKGYTVLLAGRDASRGAAVVSTIKNNGGNAEFLKADLFSKRGVSALAADVKIRAPALSILVNNAGGSFQKNELTPDGVERTFALNTLAPFLLSEALLPELSSGKGRIVNVATGVSKSLKVNPTDLAKPQKFSGLSAYSNAKLSLIALTMEQASRWATRGITAVSIHPGIILGTRFGSEMPKFVLKIMSVVARIFRMNSSLEQATARFERASTEKIKSGAFYDQDKLGTPPMQADDASFRVKLWDELEKLAAPSA